MTQTSASKTTVRISSFVLLVVFITLALSLVALILAFSVLQENSWTISDTALTLLVLGLLGLAISTYVLMETRRRMSKLKIVIPPVITTIECKKCAVKETREFQRGDYIFKETEPCKKCNDKMLITAIYREATEKEKEKYPY